MRLRNLSMSLERFGPDKGKFTGKADFGNKNGSISLKLTPEMCEKIFEVCADGIIETAKEAAAHLTCTVIEHKQSLDATPTLIEEIK